MIIVPAHLLEPARLGPGREARPLDDDDGAAVADGDVELAGRVDEQPPQVGAVRVGRGHVRHGIALVERVRPARRPVDELVADDELAEPEIGLQRTRGAGPDDPPHAHLAHRPDVRAVGDLRRRQLVASAVPRQERDPAAADLADRERRRRLAERRVDLDLLDVLEERVEARASEDSDLRLRHPG